ncbi:MAG: hypothetical protein R3C61_10465 [Bacteroidia bacterium]
MNHRFTKAYLFLSLAFALLFSQNLQSQSFTESTLSGTIGVEPTVLKFGPDGRLYISQQKWPHSRS